MENKELLRKKALQGLEDLGLHNNPEYKERLESELRVIEDLGFVTYFLVMWDISNFVKENKLLAGPGRGSAAGSLLCYCLGITLVDPIKYGLYFERFLNPERVSPPDIDYDINNRDLVIEYIENKYGKDRVARVGSLNFLRTKSAIRDIGRVLGEDFKFTEKLTNLVPPPVAGLWDSFAQECEVEPQLLDQKYAHIMGPVEKLWGVVRSYGTHAGGVAIAPGPINRFVPLYKDKDGNPVSQFDWRDLEAAGLLKFDILGLNTLEVIQLCVKYIEKSGNRVNLEKLKDGDKKAYEVIQQGRLDGIFQLGGSESIKQLTVRVAPENIEDLSMVTSLFRPGPLGAKVQTKQGLKSMVEIAIEVRQGKMEPEYIHDCVVPILESTHSVPVFQEQIMKICTDLCGYSLPEADMMRKILGKKLKSKMKEQKPKFVAGAILSGVPESKANNLFDSLTVYSQYLFNKCLTGDTKVLLLDKNNQNRPVSIDNLKGMITEKSVNLVSFNPETETIERDTCLEVIDTGEQEVFEIELSDGSKVTCTMNHKFLCSDWKKHELWEIIQKNLEIISV